MGAITEAPNANHSSPNHHHQHHQQQHQQQPQQQQHPNAANPIACNANATNVSLDLNSPPPTSSRTSSSSSSSSPPRSEISNSMATATAIVAAATSGSATATVAASTARKAPTPASPASSTAAADAEVKQQLAATTFIQADVLNFREVVQKHTGAAEDAQDKMPVTVPARQSAAAKSAPPQDAAGGPHGAANPLRRHHMSRLHERKQNNLRNLDIIRPGGSPFKRTGCSPRGGAEVSPKLVYGDALHTAAAAGVTCGNNSLLPSPVTPLSSEASFETSNPQPLTPTESLRQSFASSLHCDDVKSPSASSPVVNGGGVLERFPFLHHTGMLANHHHHQQHQQQQQQQQQHQNHQNHHPLQTHPHQFQVKNHYHGPVLHDHHQHFVFEQQNHHHHLHHQQHQHHHHQREPELLDLFPVHSTSLKESQGR